MLLFSNRKKETLNCSYIEHYNKNNFQNINLTKAIITSTIPSVIS